MCNRRPISNGDNAFQTTRWTLVSSRLDVSYRTVVRKKATPKQRVVRSTAVSYTHLDVYKRQVVVSRAVLIEATRLSAQAVRGSAEAREDSRDSRGQA